MPTDPPQHASPRQAAQTTQGDGSGPLAAPAGPALTPYARYMAQAGFRLVARTDGQGPESDWERQMYVVAPGNDAPRDHAWATARFAIECMAEHAALFTLLLPPETAAAQRAQSLLLGKKYRRLAQHIDIVGPPPPGEVRAFTRQMRDELEPILAFTQECHDLQVSGELRSLAWPLLFDHARREAEHWDDRLGRIGSGDVTPEPRAAVGFWGHALDEHARFVAHLLDPAERQAIRQWQRRSEGFQVATGSLVEEGGRATPAGELATVLELAGEALEAMTDTARQVEAGRLQGILSPRLADHWRRETVWAIEELRQAQAQAPARS
ncbi:MAG: DUF2935 domain-containing protein [Halobacteriales archaeon]|nr:DUF2935 domain-containing protein [Halobacteriales archaeon]